MTDTKEIDLSAELKFAIGLLRKMPRMSRKVFLLHVLSDFTYQQIADDLCISRKAVERHLLRAFEICAEAGRVR